MAVIDVADSRIELKGGIFTANGDRIDVVHRIRAAAVLPETLRLTGANIDRIDTQTTNYFCFIAIESDAVMACAAILI